MSLPTHLKIAGIDGESTQKGHENEIELLDWNWGVENAAKPAAGSGNATGKAVARALVFTHRYDRASPQLAKACAQGKHLATATLSARKAGRIPARVRPAPAARTPAMAPAAATATASGR